MRRGLMAWQEDMRGTADLTRRQRALQAAMERENLDAILAYTNLVRPAAVAWLTGFTPYWSDGLLLVMRRERPLFVTALSKRVGSWVASLNPTAELAHSPRPGTLVAERLAERRGRRLGIIEAALLPSGLHSEMTELGPIEISDASSLFAKVRGTADPAELRLAARAAEIATASFEAISSISWDAGAIAGDAERAARLAGAEECYIAIAPDLSKDVRFRQPRPAMMPGKRSALRVSVAYSGVWVRVTRTLDRDGEEEVDALRAKFDSLLRAFDLHQPLEPQIAHLGQALGSVIEDWWLEGPVGTLPLEVVARKGAAASGHLAYGILGTTINTAHGPVVLSRPVGLSRAVDDAS